MKRPLPLIAGSPLPPPRVCTGKHAKLQKTPKLTRSVEIEPVSSKMPSPSASRSCRNTSARPLVSPATRLVARDWNAMNRPLALIAALVLSPPSPWAPFEATLTRRTAPLNLLRT